MIEVALFVILLGVVCASTVFVCKDIRDGTWSRSSLERDFDRQYRAEEARTQDHR